MDSPVGIKYAFNRENLQNTMRIKERCEDFIVQEVVDNTVCRIGPIIDVARFLEAEQFLADLPQAELSKEERKALYDIATYHPFKRMYTKDARLCVESNSEDIFVFTVLKREHSDASLQTLMAARLSASPNNVQTGGTKDKRGITLQEISVKCSFEKLFNYAVSLSKSGKFEDPSLGYNPEIKSTNDKAIQLFSNYMTLKVMETSDDVGIYNIRRGWAKKLGDLSGNYFTIRSRNYLGKPEIITKFYNYFGPQRFGNNMNNHVIGEMIIGGKYKEALNLILADGDEKYKNATQRQIERMLAENIAPKYILDKLPRKALMIYMHAYQSYLFNMDVNLRIESGVADIAYDKVLVNGEFVTPKADVKVDEIYLPLKKMNHKLLKGGMRKMIEEIRDFEVSIDEDGCVFKFYLPKSSYATVALRELAGEISEQIPMG